MTRDAKYDLTSGGILNKLLIVALPVMGTQLLQMTYNLTDMFWLGRLSADAVASSGAAGMFLWLSFAFIIFGRMGAEIGVSQNVGRGDMKSAQGYAQTALAISVVLGILYMAVMIIFSKPLVGFFNIQEAHVAADASRYLVVVALGIPMSFVNAALTGSFTGSGNSRVPFWCNAAGLAVNMVLDPVMIFTMNMGIHGAAYATAIAQGVVTVLLVITIKKHAQRPFAQYRFFVKPDKEKVKQIFKWATPIALESGLFTFLSMTITRFTSAFGAQALAVSRVGSQIESLTWLIGGGFAMALTSFVGQNFGAGMWTRIRKGFRMSMGAMLVWGGLVTLLLLTCGRALYGVFLPDETIMDMGAVYLRILAVCQIGACVEAVAAGMFRGIGKTVPPSVVSIIGNVIRVPIAYGLSQTSLGLNGIWWGVVIGAVLRGVFILIWYLAEQHRQPLEDKRVEGAAGMRE